MIVEQDHGSCTTFEELIASVPTLKPRAIDRCFTTLATHAGHHQLVTPICDGLLVLAWHQLFILPAGKTQ